MPGGVGSIAGVALQTRLAWLVCSAAWGLCAHTCVRRGSLCALLRLPAEQLTEGALALLELAKKSNATSPVEAQPQQPQKSVYLVSWVTRRQRRARHGTAWHGMHVVRGLGTCAASSGCPAACGRWCWRAS